MGLLVCGTVRVVRAPSSFLSEEGLVAPAIEDFKVCSATSREERESVFRQRRDLVQAQIP